MLRWTKLCLVATVAVTYGKTYKEFCAESQCSTKSNCCYNFAEVKDGLENMHEPMTQMLTLTEARAFIILPAIPNAWCDDKGGGKTCTCSEVDPAFASCADPAPTPAPTVAKCTNPVDPAKDSHVIGYFVNWAQWRKPDERPDNNYEVTAKNTNYCPLTHVIYSFVGVQLANHVITGPEEQQQTDEYRKNNVHWTEKNPTTIEPGEIVPMEYNDHQQWIDMKNTIAEQGAKTKMMLSVGGWTAGTLGFHEMAKDATKRGRFIHSIKAVSDKYGFAGVDLDWEYPGWITVDRTDPKKLFPYGNIKASDKGRSYNAARADVDRANYCTLLQEMRAVLGTDYIITAAVKANPRPTLYDRECMAQQMNWIGIMAYDYHGAWDSDATIGGFSAMTDNRLQDGYGTDHAWTYWSASVPKEKLVVGLGLYGKAFPVKENAAETNPKLFLTGGGKKYVANKGGVVQQGEYLMEVHTFAWYEINMYWPDKSKWYYDEDNFVWSVNSANAMVTFDDPCSLVNKTQWALRQKGAAGVMIWDLSYDDIPKNFKVTHIISDASRDIERSITCTRSTGTKQVSLKYAPGGIVAPTPAPTPVASDNDDGLSTFVIVAIVVAVICFVFLAYKLWKDEKTFNEDLQTLGDIISYYKYLKKLESEGKLTEKQKKELEIAKKQLNMLPGPNGAVESPNITDPNDSHTHGDETSNLLF